MDRVRWMLFFWALLLVPLSASADWVTVSTGQVVNSATQSVIRHDWTSSATDSTPYNMSACTAGVDLRFDASTGDTSTDATFQARMCKTATATAPHCRAIRWPGPSDGATWVAINAITEGENYLLVDPLTATAGGDTARVEARCTGQATLAADAGGPLIQAVPSLTTSADSATANITNPATVKYGYGVVTEGGPPYTFTAKNYNGSATDGSEPDNMFGFYYNRCDVLTTSAGCTNMFEHAWDWSWENSYRDTSSTADETWVEHNMDIKPPDISAPTTGSSTSGWVAGDTLLFSGGGTGQIVSTSGSDPTKTIVWRQNFGTTAAGETVSNITHATSAATLGALTGTGTYWRPYLSVYKTLSNGMSFYWYTSPSDASPILDAGSGHARTKGRVIAGSVIGSHLTATALATAEIAAGACDSSVTSTATGALSTDVVRWAYNTTPGTTGGRLIVNPVVSANTITWVVCNPTAGNITPGARGVNWVVDRWL